MSKQDTAKNVVLGLAVGLAAGYIAGLLTAPKSGKETRDDIKRVSGRTIELAQEKLRSVQSQVATLVDQAKGRAKKMTASGKKQLNTLVDNATEAQAKAKAVLSAVQDGTADDPDLRRAVEQAAAAKEALSDFLKNN